MPYKFEVKTVFPGFPGRAELWGFGWGAVYLIRAESDLILVDTGGPGPTPFFPGQFKKLGAEMKDVTKVFITHIHWDHAYALDQFPQAEFIYSQADYDYVKNKGDLAVYYPALEVLDRSKVHVVTQENEEIVPGARVILLPGHSPGSIGLVLDNEGRTEVFTADAVKNRVELMTCIANGNAGDTVSTASIKKIKEMADLVYPGHDGPLKIEDGKVIPLGGNDVKIVMPKGLLVNGLQELILHIDSES